MADVAVCLRMTEEEYLAFERASEERHEFVDGAVFLMPASAGRHSLVIAGFICQVGLSTLERKIYVMGPDMRLFTPASNRYVYPDASVVCGRPQYKDEQIDNLLNPRVIVEVLSSSTEAYDRGDKFTNYRTIPSLTHYIMASQEKPFVEVYTRQDDGSWKLREYGAGTLIELSALDCSIRVDQIYAGVFDEYDVG
jgi:Uma2 family endonuclease